MYLCALKTIGMTGQKTPTALGTEKIGKLLMQYAIPAIIAMASKAIFLSISRQVLVLIPCLLILPRFYGQLGVWISMPISDLIASLIAGGMLWWQFRQFRKATA